MSQSVSCTGNHHHHHHHHQQQQHLRQQQQQQQQHADSNAFDMTTAPLATVLCSTSTGYHHPPLHSNLPSTASGTTSAFDRSQQTPVIVAPNGSAHIHQPPPPTVRPGSNVSSPDDMSSTSTNAPSTTSTANNLYDATVATASTPYLTAQSCCYLSSDSSPVLQPPCASSSSGFIYSSNFFQPYYGLSPTLSDFNVLQMCCQPLFSEVCFVHEYFFFHAFLRIT